MSDFATGKFSGWLLRGLLGGALLLFLSPAENVFSASAAHVIYKVRGGDYLGRIARKFGVSVSSLRRANGLKQGEAILVGQRLKVPRAVRAEEETVRESAPSGNPGFRKPLPGAGLVQGYRTSGDVRNYGYWYRTRSHRGVRAASGGRVVRIATMRGYGRYIMIDHGGGWLSMYSNLDRVLVRKGQDVSDLQPLGKVKDGKFFFSLSYQGKPVNPGRYL